MDNKRTLNLMNKFFKKGTYKGEKGWYGYKLFETPTFGYMFPVPKHWKITKGSVLVARGRGRLNKDIRRYCARGVHFATKGWIMRIVDVDNFPDTLVFKTFVPRSNLDNIIISDIIHQYSHSSHIKARTDRLTLVRQVDKNK